VTDYNIDLVRAHVSFSYEPLGGQENDCIGRVYYWHNPSGEREWIRDWDLRKHHPWIDDELWDELFYDAFDRGEAAFEAELFQTVPPAAATSTEFAQANALGRLFGPRPPRNRRTADQLAAAIEEARDNAQV
jgi:hypothetical protein